MMPRPIPFGRVRLHRTDAPNAAGRQFNPPQFANAFVVLPELGPIQVDLSLNKIESCQHRFELFDNRKGRRSPMHQQADALVVGPISWDFPPREKDAGIGFGQVPALSFTEIPGGGLQRIATSPARADDAAATPTHKAARSFNAPTVFQASI